MKVISEVLDRQIETRLDGLKMNHGKMSIQSNNIITSKLTNQDNKELIESKTKQQSEECYELKTPISKNPESKKKLTKLVTACFKAMNTYGGTNESLEASVMIMQMVLGKYSYEVVRSAFEKYIENNSDMPKPADIVKIIDPPMQKKEWCKVTFLEIKRKKLENIFTTDEEDKYCEDFIKASLQGNSDSRELLSNAIKQDELENKKYWLEG